MTERPLLHALTAILAALEPLDEAERARVMTAVAAIGGKESVSVPSNRNTAPVQRGIRGSLSDEQVSEYRDAFKRKTMTVADMARASDLSRAQIYQMLHGRSYKHVK